METHRNMKNMNKQQSLQALAKPGTNSGSENAEQAKGVKM